MWKKVVSLLVVVMIIAGWYVSLAGMDIGSLSIEPAKENLKLGLDLEGGVYVLFEAETDLTGADLDKLMEQTQAIIENRVNGMGLSEPIVTIESGNRIRVELPGVSDAEEALEAIGKTAQLEFVDAWGKVVLTGADVADATLGFDSQSIGNEPIISLSLTSEGADKFKEATEKAVANKGIRVDTAAYGTVDGGIIMIVLDGEIISAPQVNSVITGGQAMISGSYTREEASRQAALIRSGTLPVTLQELNSSYVGASLGKDALDNSILAGAIGVLLIIIFMCVAYKIMGAVSGIALLGYILLYIGFFTASGAVLTLPGIAGVILTIGMAVDANVIIFARIREEISSGKSVRVSVKAGFSRAMTTIIDSNITTLIAGAVLYMVGTGSVRGFALTLMIGIILSMFTALVITKLFVVVLAETKTFGKESFFMWNKKFLNGEKQVPVIEKRKIWYTISIVVMVVGLLFGMIRGFNWGIDFVGGTMIQVDLEQEAEVADIEEILAGQGIQASIVHAGEGNQEIIIRTTESLDSEQRGVILDQLYEKYQVDQENLITTDQFEGSVGKELQRNAVLAVIVACIAMLIYIAFRFELRFGIAAILALLCDVIVMISIYGLFQVQINSPFIAALLVILGYSINNTIVVFDRVRENMKLNKKMKSDQLINVSVTQTLSRTLCTSITTIMAISALLVMGTSSIRDFIFPIMVGMIAGTYSSIFVSGGIWYDINRFFKKKKYAGK